MRTLTALALASSAVGLAVPSAIASEDIFFSNAAMVLDRDSETKVVGFGVTLQPSSVRCDAANFTFPSPEFKCGDSAYTIALDKVPDFYVRFTIRISHRIEDGYVKSQVPEIGAS
jgi:hypothetical protein